MADRMRRYLVDPEIFVEHNACEKRCPNGVILPESIDVGPERCGARLVQSVMPKRTPAAHRASGTAWSASSEIGSAERISGRGQGAAQGWTPPR